MLHFSAEEFQARRDKLRAELIRQNFDGILIFKQESSYYLTGYDTFGFVFFQCLVFMNDGNYFLLTRSADLRQAQLTSDIKEIHIWKDSATANPAQDLVNIMKNKGLKGKKFAVEYDSYGLTGKNCKLLEAECANFIDLKDGSLIISKLRLVKSAQELIYIKKAAELADNALEIAQKMAVVGQDEGAILAAMQGEIFNGGGDYSGNPFIIGSGDYALLCRTKSGRHKLQDGTGLTLEWAGAYRMYHAAMMRTLPIGRASNQFTRYYNIAKEALLACEASLQSGKTMGEVFAKHCEVMDKHGLSKHRLNACGYAMGALFQPNWMDYPMFYEDNPIILHENMVFFLHMIIMDSDSKTAVCLGRSSIVHENNCEVLSKSVI